LIFSCPSPPKMRFSLFSVLVFVFCFLPSSWSLYSPSDKVIQLTPQNFQSSVLKSSDLWLVEFYAPWCGHCKNLAPEWKKAAAALEGIVKLGAVDMDAHPQLGQPYEVKGFPTIKFFAINKNKPVDFQGGRTAKDITEWVLSQAKQIVSARLSGKAGSSSSGSSNGGSSGGGSSGSGSSGKKGSQVVTLTAANFDELVLKTDDAWMVEFFAPWCGHCKNLAPHWERASAELDGQVKLGAVDATVYTDLANKYGVRGYPTIKVFKAGEKDKPSDYNGERTADGIISFGRALGGGGESGATVVVKDVLQLTSPEVFDEYCKTDIQLCFLAFLPHIYESSASQRDSYVNFLKQAAEKFGKRGFSFLWTEAGAQFAFEEKLGISSNFYPGVLALNVKKGRYAPMTSSFSEENLADFIRGLQSGREKTIPLPANLPNMVKVDEWDGKDVPKDESAQSPEVDLSDLTAEDDD